MHPSRCCPSVGNSQTERSSSCCETDGSNQDILLLSAFACQLAKQIFRNNNEHSYVYITVVTQKQYIINYARVIQARTRKIDNALILSTSFSPSLIPLPPYHSDGCTVKVVMIKFFLLTLPLSLIPLKPVLPSQGSQMDLLPSGSANLWPGNREAIYLFCSMLCVIWDVCVHVEWSVCECLCVCMEARGTVVNSTMQNPDAAGPKVAITDLGKLMFCVRKNPTWFSSCVNELGKDNGSLELGREMRTGWGNRWWLWGIFSG